MSRSKNDVGQAKLTPKSKPGEKESYIWHMLDEGGDLTIVCHGPFPSVSSAASPAAIVASAKIASREFRAALGKRGRVSSILGVNGSALVV